MKPRYTQQGPYLQQKYKAHILSFLKATRRNYSKEKLNAKHRTSQASMPPAPCTQAHFYISHAYCQSNKQKITADHTTGLELRTGTSHAILFQATLSFDP